MHKAAWHQTEASDEESVGGDFPVARIEREVGEEVEGEKITWGWSDFLAT